jgi:two-component sensor histidine kinase
VIKDEQGRVGGGALLGTRYYRGQAVSFSEHLKHFCDHLAHSYSPAERNIRFIQKITDTRLDMDQAIVAGLIVNELVTNALKHAFVFRPGGDIRVELQKMDEHRLVLRVSDNGVGLSSETSPETTGTVGLLLVRNLTRQLEGKLSVTNRQGAVFEIVFPHEAAILNLAKAILERLGYTLLPPGTPSEAMRQVETHSSAIDLLITEVVLPEMNGRDLSKRLTQLYPAMKILLMSGYTANVIAQHGVLAKGVNLIQKPFSRRDLAIKADEALGKGPEGWQE